MKNFILSLKADRGSDLYARRAVFFDRIKRMVDTGGIKDIGVYE